MAAIIMTMQTALSMYKAQILCFFYGKSGYFGDRTQEMYHILRCYHPKFYAKCKGRCDSILGK